MFNEREVITRVLGGDVRAFELLVKQYEKLVFYVIHRLVKDKHAAEDICQEVFIKVHKSLVRFSFQSKLSTWIARIAYLTAINYVKKYNRERAWDYLEDIENYHFTTDTPQNLLEKKDMANYIEQLIMQLPERYRTVLTLYHLNEFSGPEIEEIIGMPEGTVKNYLFRARKLLKEKLELYLKHE
ncbi:RNA polymerase sigma factor [Mucilaginibacter ginsenosidivorans]|uniref:RNA polymerase sigma factor n=1 Tax=Mucilaginibacter ginsenosidivorans TaxID=398053 RepID=A0A5B8UZ87_9SPHI|nr:RNA polymerase sigma factor [Mucilaginibacter ginsenosidivorans]QEC64258.1 RNA polymerase sigma factor [Mucilaginibacter ginsenosidivorans]